MGFLSFTPILHLPMPQSKISFFKVAVFLGALSLLYLLWAVDSSIERDIDLLIGFLFNKSRTTLDDSLAPHKSPEITTLDKNILKRGKVLGSVVTASDLAAAYNAIKSEYYDLALVKSQKTYQSSEFDWHLLQSHTDGSEVSLLHHSTDPSCPYVRITSIMPGSVEDVWDFLRLENWDETMPKMDPFYEGIEILGDYHYRDLDMILARKTTTRIITFGERDFTFISVSDQPRADNDAWVSGTVSVITDQFPRKDGYVRAFQDSIAFYTPIDDDETTGLPRTKLTIVFRIDLNDSGDGGSGGYIPMWLYVKTVGKTGMLSVQNMKKQLKQIVDSKRMIKSKQSAKNNGRVCQKKWFFP